MRPPNPIRIYVFKFLRFLEIYVQNLGLQVEINKNSQFKDINDREFEYYDVVAVNAVSAKVTYKTSILALLTFALMCVHFMKRSPFWVLLFEKFHISDVCLSGGQNIRRGFCKKSRSSYVLPSSVSLKNFRTLFGGRETPGVHRPQRV